MSIEFSCSQCGQKLRVSNEAAGKRAKCPKCSQVNQIPEQSATPEDPFGGGSSDPFGGGSSDPFGGTGGGSSDPFGGIDDSEYNLAPDQPTSEPSSSPFGGGGSASANPYASPQTGFATASAPVAKGVRNVPVDIGSILNYSVEVWKNNLGLLVGATLAIGGINFGISALQGGVSGVMQANNQPEIAALVDLGGSVVSWAIQFYLGIGLTQMMLKLARGRRAEFNDLFEGGPRFLPVFGVSLLFGLATFAGFLMLIIPGIIVLLLWWPCYYLVVDEKTGVIESFGAARAVTEGNVGTTFLMWLTGLGISLLGLLACCIGLLFAYPLVEMMKCVAYLMMSGQIPLEPRAKKRLV